LVHEWVREFIAALVQVLGILTLLQGKHPNRQPFHCVLGRSDGYPEVYRTPADLRIIRGGEYTPALTAG
jgi:hypothetical protein